MYDIMMEYLLVWPMTQRYDTDYSESEFSRSLPRATGYAMGSARRWPQVTISVKFGAKPPSLRSPGGTFAHRNEPNREDVKYNVFGPILVENFFLRIFYPKVNCPLSIFPFILFPRSYPHPS